MQNVLLVHSISISKPQFCQLMLCTCRFPHIYMYMLHISMLAIVSFYVAYFDQLLIKSSADPFFTYFFFNKFDSSRKVATCFCIFH